jgi:hypothetical protein
MVDSEKRKRILPLLAILAILIILAIGLASLLWMIDGLTATQSLAALACLVPGLGWTIVVVRRI